MKVLPAILILFAWCSVGWAESAPSEIVLQTIAMESAGESLEGQAMVARVIINRSRASGSSLSAVCKARRQFSCWDRPKHAKRWLLRHFNSKVRGKAIRAYRQALIANSRYARIRHYHAKGVYPRWAYGVFPVAIVSNHVFYEGVK